VVDDKAHVRKGFRGGQSRGQLAGTNQDVIRQIGVSDRGETPSHIRAQQPFGVGLIVDLVANADKRPAVGWDCSSARVSATVGSVRSTQPTTPATKRVRCAISMNSRVSCRLGTVCTRTE
jgi:hypothetical protein